MIDPKSIKETLTAKQLGSLVSTWLQRDLVESPPLQSNTMNILTDQVPKGSKKS